MASHYIILLQKCLAVYIVTVYNFDCDCVIISFNIFLCMTCKVSTASRNVIFIFKAISISFSCQSMPSKCSISLHQIHHKLNLLRFDENIKSWRRYRLNDVHKSVSGGKDSVGARLYHSNVGLYHWMIVITSKTTCYKKPWFIISARTSVHLQFSFKQDLTGIMGLIL